MKKTLLAISFLLVTSAVWAQTSGRPKIYLNQNDEFSNAFAAGVEKKQVPVALVTDPAQAQYTVDFSHESNNGSKARGITTAVFTGVYADGSFERVSMKVVDVQTKEIVFSYTCTKGRGGIQPAAECLAKHWKQHLSKH
jgi:hypothetical protein